MNLLETQQKQLPQCPLSLEEEVEMEEGVEPEEVQCGAKASCSRWPC